MYRDSLDVLPHNPLSAFTSNVIPPAIQAFMLRSGTPTICATGAGTRFGEVERAILAAVHNPTILLPCLEA